MNTTFFINDILWRVIIVNPNSRMLIDRTNRLTLGTCDPISHIIYISSTLRDDLFIKVLIHELGHCMIFSYHLDEEIYRMVKPEYRIEAEESLCNFMYDYGFKIFKTAERIMGVKALDIIPKELEKLIA